MKKTKFYILALALCVLLAGCGKSVFALTENGPKAMTVTAERADKGASFMAGSLEVADAEQIVITSALTKGEIRLELIAAPAEQSIDVLPDMDGEATVTGNFSGAEELRCTVPAGSYMLRAACLERADGTVKIRVLPGETPAAASEAGYGQLKGDFAGLTPEAAGAYLAVMDELAGRLGYDGTEAAEGEYLHGGFVRDWDGDGAPELCLLLQTGPRDEAGTPLYGWNPPTLYLYAFRDGQAVRAGECDLYFATAGREAAAAALSVSEGVLLLRWDRSGLEDVTFADCYALAAGGLEKTETPDWAAEAVKADTARGVLEALGPGRAQLLLYNSSGEARIEGEPNARELREALEALAG